MCSAAAAAAQHYHQEGAPASALPSGIMPGSTRDLQSIDKNHVALSPPASGLASVIMSGSTP